jgi:hypothetical protein
MDQSFMDQSLKYNTIQNNSPLSRYDTKSRKVIHEQ